MAIRSGMAGTASGDDAGCHPGRASGPQMRGSRERQASRIDRRIDHEQELDLHHREAMHYGLATCLEITVPAGVASSVMHSVTFDGGISPK